MGNAITVNIEKIYTAEGKIILLIAVFGPKGCWRREAITSIHGGRLTTEQLGCLHDGWRSAQIAAQDDEEDQALPLDWGV